MIRKVLIWLCLLGLVFGSVVWADEGDGGRLIELDLVKVFPAEDEKDVWFKSSIVFDVDDYGNVYTFDANHHHRVFKMNPIGKLIKTIGSRGKGAGNIYRPKEILIKDDMLFVRDSLAISVFTLDGRFLSRFSIKKRVSVFSAFPDRICIIERQTPKLFTLYDLKGQKIGGFGNRYNVDYSLFHRRDRRTVEEHVYDGYLFCEDDRLYYIPQFMGEIHTYDKQGTLLHTKNIGGLDDQLIDKYRRFYLQDNRKQRVENGYIFLFGGMDFFEGKLHLLDLGRAFYDCVFEYDMETMKPEKRFKYYYDASKKKRFASLEIAVKRVDGAKYYYVSTRSFENWEYSIRVYKEK